MVIIYQSFWPLKTIPFGQPGCGFSLGGLQAGLGLIEADPPRTVNGNFSAANVKLTGEALSFMTSKMGDAAMDLADGAETVKELLSRLYLQYHEKGWGAESILFQKLVHLHHYKVLANGSNDRIRVLEKDS